MLRTQSRSAPGVHTISLILSLFCVEQIAIADQFEDLCADRTAIEHVYYSHRTGTQKPFAEFLPPSSIRKLVDEDLHKESVLRSVYHVEISDAEIQAEVARMESSSRAPDVLKELEQALANDRNRIGRSLAKPFLVERTLRKHFADDSSLHQAQRQKIQDLRADLLKMKKEEESLIEILKAARSSEIGVVDEVTWTFGQGNPSHVGSTGQEVKSTGGAYSLEALPSSTNTASNSTLHPFEDLPPRLQGVLKAQLNKPRDLSAVIELPTSFILCVLKERTRERISVTMVSSPKRDYDTWLRDQPFFP